MIKSGIEPFLYPPRGDRPVVFCFHHAGGSARTFQGWRKTSEADFIPVELPGHGFRAREALCTDIRPLAARLAQAIAETVRARSSGFPGFSLFGHSLGAILAFCVADELVHNWRLRPEALYVAGRHAPQDEDPSPYRTHMGMAALERELRSLGHTPAELLENREFLDWMMPVLYSDYRLSESYVHRGIRIPVPIIAHWGNRDREAGPGQMCRWEAVTSGQFDIRGFEGDHFFPHQEELRYPRLIAQHAAASRRKHTVSTAVSAGAFRQYEKGWI